MRRVALVLLLLLISAGAGRTFQNREGAADLRPTVILISFDGWRWDYQTKAAMPNLRSVMARGVRAENLIPGFPSKTYPNHYTIVTGLYPGHHGIVANNIKDPATGRTFAMTKPEEVRDPMWWGGEPIWVTAQRQRQTAASMFWPGSEAPIGGVLPRYWKAYDARYPPNGRVDQVLQWLDLPTAERPTFVTLYFSDTDTAGHDDGPDSQAVRDAIVRVDGYLGRLLRGLERRGLADRVNIVVVSDHGMAAVSTDRVVVVDDYISLEDVEIADINPTIGIFPRPGKDEAVFRALVNAHPRLKVYRRNTTPEQWHYRDHPRIPPIVGVADEGWQVLRRGTMAGILAGRIRAAGGQHGYDPAAMSMRGLFVAAGPAFRQGATVPAFENVHIYNALAKVLGVAPANNDGDPAVARRLLQ
ncbi:MAG: alkaline phosphatase family protein [Acidobacteria bacterium]|nr:alkaline phosphatase family protein [Acidobacteriota bacterium]